MKTLLFVLAVLAFLAGVLVLMAAESAIHEVEAFVLFVCSSVLLAGSCIVEAVNQVGDRLASSPVASNRRDAAEVSTFVARVPGGCERCGATDVRLKTTSAGRLCGACIEEMKAAGA